MRDTAGVRVRPLAEGDLDEADRICRVAFGTFLGVPDPEKFFGDADLVRTRWKADPGAGLAAELDGRLAGSNFAANWGSVGFFGPLTIAPEVPEPGHRPVSARRHDGPVRRRETRHVGLFTFAHSAKHVGLYQKYGFWPRFLTAVMSAPVDPDCRSGAIRVSGVGDEDLAGVMTAVRELTDAVHPGLDLSREIEAVQAQRLGDTVLIDDAAGLQGVAICHVGAGTEAASGRARHVKSRRRSAGSRCGTPVRPAHRRVSRAGRERGASVVVAGAKRAVTARGRCWPAGVSAGTSRA